MVSQVMQKRRAMGVRVGKTWQDVLGDKEL